MKLYLQRNSPQGTGMLYYSIQIQRDLLGRWQVIREWGRLGSPGTLRQTPHDDMDKAVAQLSALKDQLMEKGYRVVMQEGLRAPRSPSQEAESAG
ncbi:MAG: WGR domain-containing protein [Magnetococcales bacterium]|nr:WGR domain-containing protein [Magnetococcales bacterium]